MASNYQSFDTDNFTESGLSSMIFAPPSQLSEVHRGYLLSMFIFISICAAINGLLCSLSVAWFAGQIISNGQAFLTSDNLLQLYILCYCCVMSIGIVCIEMELTETIRSMIVLQSWCLRGFFYAFVGLLSLQQIGGFSLTIVDQGLPEFIKWPCLTMAAFGAIYAVMVGGVE